MTKNCPLCGEEYILISYRREWCPRCKQVRKDLETVYRSISDNPFGKPEECKDCPLFREPGIVHGFGPEDAKMMFVGEAPGAEEVDEPKYRVEHFKPFIGGSGRLLTVICIHADVDRRDVYVTNVVRCRPPDNRTPTMVEMHYCGRFLIGDIHRVNPNVIVALGETALRMLTDKEKIGNWRGVPLEGFEGRKIFPTWHPAFIARAPQNWPFAVHDIARAQYQSAFPELRRVPYEVVRDSTPVRDAEQLLKHANERGALTFDLETTGLSYKDDSIVYLGVVAKDNVSHVMPWNVGTRDFIQKALDDPKIEIIGQNILYFDLPFLEAKGVNVDKAWPRVFDSMVAFHLANASYGQTSIKEQSSKSPSARGMEKDLTMIASCHTDMEYWKSKDDYKRDLLGVCGKDCIATDRSVLDPAFGLKAELKALGMTDLYHKHVLPVHPILHRMTKLGVNVDIDRAVSWSAALEDNASRLEKELRSTLGEPLLDVNSHKELKEILYEKLGLPVQYAIDAKTKKSRPSVDADSLEALIKLNPDNSILQSIIDIRYCRKMRSTFLDKFIRQGRIHPKFGVSKASTGRFNSWDPNAQNVPEDMRDIWIPDSPEHVILASDWGQIEWRLSLILSGDIVGLEMLASGIDSHKMIAAEILRKKIEDVQPNERQSAKYVVYGLGYGRGAESLSRSSRQQRGGSSRTGIPPLPIEWIETFIARFFAKFKDFAAWREENISFVQQNNYLANAFGRRRWWYTPQTTEVYNYPQQSTAADMMYDTLIALNRELPKDASLRLTVHDEVVLNVPKDIIKPTVECVISVMQRTWPQIEAMSRRPDVVRKFYPSGWFCPADAHIGNNWKQAKSKDPADIEVREALEKGLGLAL